MNYTNMVLGLIIANSCMHGMEKKWDVFDIGDWFEFPESYELFTHQYEQSVADVADDEVKKREWMYQLDWKSWHDAFAEYERLFKSDGSLK